MSSGHAHATSSLSDSADEPARGLAARALVLLIFAYQAVVSPFFGPACRFEPSCSRYAVRAIGRHGALRGSWLAAKRIGRCHPFHSGGYDPVP